MSELLQTVLGTAIGPFLAIIFSIFGFRIKTNRDKKKEKQEGMRQAEIALTQTLNYTFFLTEELKGFIIRIEEIIERISLAKDNQYAFPETNFPAIIPLPFDEGLTKIKTKSYYLHNKLLMIAHLVSWINHLFPQVRKDYERLLFKNEFLINKEAPQESQRKMYKQNLKSFLEMLKGVIESIEKENIPAVIKTIVYNRKLRENESETVKRHEKNIHTLSKIKEIDESLEEEAAEELQKIEKNAKRK